MKLSEVIKVWDLIHPKVRNGDLGYCDFDDAMEEVFGKIENDCLSLPEIQARHAREDAKR